MTGAPGGEGAKYWLHVLTEIKNRGVGDVLMVVCDGLTGLPDAISTVTIRVDYPHKELITRLLADTCELCRHR